MNTERDIIYTILNTVRAGEYNLDEPLTERLLRSFLKTHRASKLFKHYRRGDRLHDMCFQEFNTIAFKASNNTWAFQLPSVIPFPDNQGVQFNKDGYIIPVVSAKKWKNNQKDRWSKIMPGIKIVANTAYLYLGQDHTTQNVNDDLSLSEHNIVVNALNTESLQGTVTLSGRFVLQNPDDQPSYDWTKDQYPFPAEMIDQLVNSVTARELNIFIRTNSDDIGNKFSNENPNTQTEEL